MLVAASRAVRHGGGRLPRRLGRTRSPRLRRPVATRTLRLRAALWCVFASMLANVPSAHAAPRSHSSWGSRDSRAARCHRLRCLEWTTRPRRLSTGSHSVTSRPRAARPAWPARADPRRAAYRSPRNLRLCAGLRVDTLPRRQRRRECASDARDSREALPHSVALDRGPPGSARGVGREAEYRERRLQGRRLLPLGRTPTAAAATTSSTATTATCTTTLFARGVKVGDNATTAHNAGNPDDSSGLVDVLAYRDTGFRGPGPVRAGRHGRSAT